MTKKGQKALKELLDEIEYDLTGKLDEHDVLRYVKKLVELIMQEDKR